MRGNDDRATAEVIRMLEAGELHEALARLNQGTSHRFTGVYRLDPPTLRNIALFDRENPRLRLGSDAPLRETYCSITAATAAPFATEDAAADPGLTEHPARETTRSYCGVPLLDAEGRAFGTLCHFDTVPRETDRGEAALLGAVAGRVARLVGAPPA